MLCTLQILSVLLFLFISNISILVTASMYGTLSPVSVTLRKAVLWHWLTMNHITNSVHSSLFHLAVFTRAVLGQQNTFSEQLTTKYGCQWLTLKWSATLLLRLSRVFACKIVPWSFDNIKHIKRSPIRISLFYYDTTYSLCTYNQRPSINTV